MQNNTTKELNSSKLELFSTANKKILFIGLAVATLFLTAMFLIGTFLDYQIAHGVGVDQFTFFYIAFGMVFEALGFLPAIAVNVTLFAILVNFFKRKHFKILSRIGCIAFLAGAVYCAVFWTLANHGIRISDRSSVHHGVAGGISTAVAIGVSFPFVRLFRKLPDLTMRRLIYILLIGLVMGTIANSTSAIMQMFWGRYRFYAIVNYDIPFFTPWYQPFGRSGTAEGFGSTSFPSLHATSVTSMIILMLVGWSLGKHKHKKTWIILWSTVAVMLLAVPLSRMVLRWHFLTDVTFSLIIGLVSFIIGIVVVDLLLGKKMKAFINPPALDSDDINIEQINVVIDEPVTAEETTA